MQMLLLRIIMVSTHCITLLYAEIQGKRCFNFNMLLNKTFILRLHFMSPHKNLALHNGVITSASGSTYALHLRVFCL